MEKERGSRTTEEEGGRLEEGGGDGMGEELNTSKLNL